MIWIVGKGILWPHSSCTHCFLTQICSSHRNKLASLQNFTFEILLVASSKAHKNRLCYTKSLSPANKQRHYHSPEMTESRMMKTILAVGHDVRDETPLVAC